MTSKNTIDHQLVGVVNNFALRLFVHILEREPHANVFVSPFSIATTLMLLYIGAAGDTKREISETLGLKRTSLDKLDEAYGELRRTAAERTVDESQLTVANSLWARQGIEFNPDFVRRANRYFGAEFANLNFADRASARVVNDWVKGRTRGKIPDVLKPDDMNTGTMLIFISAVYFKGVWQTKFDESKTKEDAFSLPDGNTKQHPMMSRSGTYKYYETKGFRAVDLPYDGGQTSMVVFLTDDPTAFKDFQKNLIVKNWQRWLSRFAEMEGDLTMPRFVANYETTLNDVLGALGMELAFNPNADFRSIGINSLFISKVKHKSVVEVNEEGTEAAAATAVMMNRSLPRSFHMIVDRPFFYIIRDNQTGMILFTGSMMRP